MANLNHLLNQVLRSQNELKEKQVEAVDRDGLVTAVVTCTKQLVDIHIAETDICSLTDIKPLKNNIIEAVNEALKKADTIATQQMLGITKGLIDVNLKDDQLKNE